MTAITELDSQTVERIAAGEVVTRPASVVTELVENALDAGAESIKIEVENSGLDLIRVADDGHGMTEDDALLATERHTTSKISGVGDVSRIETLGFRGEALPSIAHVARLELTTKAPESGAAGTRIVVENGEKTAKPAGRAVGTTVSVTDLFANVPARRKSLAQPKQEFSRISGAVAGYALTHPGVRFLLAHNDRTVLSTPGTGSHTDAVLGVYDREVASQSTEFEFSSEDIHVNGLVAYPAVTRASSAHVTTAVNGRTLRDATIRHAVESGYGSLLPDGRHPIAVINVSLPPEEVDANVHPSKAEVRFHDPDAVDRAVEKAVSEALSTESLARTADLDFDLGTIDEMGASKFDSVSVIGGFRDLYLLCESEDDLLVVDQHAAHERINYERLREALDESDAGESGGAVLGWVESVEIEPTTLSLTAAEAALVESHKDELDALGFRIESDESYRVTEVPAPLGRVVETEAIHDVLDALLAGEEPDDPREELLRELACHPSLKAGDALNGEDATKLVRRLGACEQPFACPHGRPTVLRIDEKTFAQGFERPNTRFD